MQLSVLASVRADEADDLWAGYARAFESLRAAAVQRHLMTREEFDTVVTDKRVGKYVVRDPARGGAFCGMATLTNDLTAVPLISPEYFAGRWPELYAQGLIWYIGFLAVDPDYQGAGVLGRLIETLCGAVAPTGGMIAADICEYNESEFRLPNAFARIARTFSPGIGQRRLDAQVYWAYEFPAPA